MAQRGLPKIEQQRARDARERAARAEFLHKLTALPSPSEAHLLVRAAPLEGSPGRRFYANLGFFLQRFTPPAEADPEELTGYLHLIQRWGSAGALQAGEQTMIETALRQALDRKPG